MYIYQTQPLRGNCSCSNADRIIKEALVVLGVICKNDEGKVISYIPSTGLDMKSVGICKCFYCEFRNFC